RDEERRGNETGTAQDKFRAGAVEVPEHTPPHFCSPSTAEGTCFTGAFSPFGLLGVFATLANRSLILLRIRLANVCSEGARRRRAVPPAAARRRGDRIECKFAALLECALDSGQFQAAVLTGCWAWRSSYCAGLRYPSAEWSLRVL